jgi:hypothetical protein
MIKSPFVVIVRHRQNSRHVFPESANKSTACKPFYDPNVICKQLRLYVSKSCLPSSNRKALARRTARNKIDLFYLLRIEFSNVTIDRNTGKTMF